MLKKSFKAHNENNLANSFIDLTARDDSNQNLINHNIFYFFKNAAKIQFFGIINILDFKLI